MNNIARAFEKADGTRKKAFIPFITCGDPSLELTEEAVVAMAAAGADIIELGIPFSDPTAEGPVIQAANTRALASGTTTDDAFVLARRVRLRGVDIPLIFMTYANVVFSYGIEKFAHRASLSGIDGVILPDVPFEEKDEFAIPFAEKDIELISMIAPTSHDRVRAIAKEARGFVYCVSSLGVTGVRKTITTDVGAMTNIVREETTVPCAIGFGISTPEQAVSMAAKSDGAIVGSAIVRIVEEHGNDAVPFIADYVREMAAAIHDWDNAGTKSSRA